MDTYYIDGHYVDEDKCVLSVKDIIVLRGFGVFDFLITYNKRPFYLKEHVQRLETSAQKIGLKIRHSNDEICSIVEETLRRNAHHDESNIRIVYTGGISSDGVTPDGNGYLIVMVTPRHQLPDWWYSEGAKLVTAEIERFIPGAKSTNYLTAVWALERARAMDAIESIYVDRNNRLLEGATSNFFCFKENKLITPKLDILPGITRIVLVDLVKDHFNLDIREIQKNELPSMQEIFISASNKEIVPIIQVDDTVIGDGKPGQRTQKVMQLFEDHTTAYGQGMV
jgi:branched-chain amino acid aminotransferase